MPIGPAVRLTPDTHSALTTLKRRIAAEADREITFGALIDSLIVLAEQHKPELITLIQERL